MQQKVPGVRIKFAHFLEPIFLIYVRSNPKNKDWVAPKRNEIDSKIEAYKTEWSKYGNSILTGMTSLLGLQFKQNIIDVYIVTAYKGVFSDPLVIPSSLEPDVFVDTLTHELIHRILTDNTKGSDISSILNTLFPTEERLVRNHNIFVHAVHQYIYLDVLKDRSRLEREI